jgi:hypothetical protein
VSALNHHIFTIHDIGERRTAVLRRGRLEEVAQTCIAAGPLPLRGFCG